jgi:hypothetical protein
MKKYFIFIFIINAFIACNNGSKQNNNQSIANLTINEQKKIQLDRFTMLPQEIEGCGSYFFLTEKDKQEEKYICVNDFANLAFVSISGKLEKFVLKEHKDGDKIYQYSNDTYNLKIEILKKIDAGDETSNIEGVIVIQTKDGNYSKFNFIGYCGC